MKHYRQALVYEMSQNICVAYFIGDKIVSRSSRPKEWFGNVWTMADAIKKAQHDSDFVAFQETASHVFI